MSGHLRCFVDGSLQTPEIKLEGQEAHRLLRVLRVKPGDRVDLFNKEGATAQACVISTTNRCLALRLDQQPASGTMPAYSITLLQAVIKGPRMDWLVAKCVELGVGRLVPVVTARTVAFAPGKAEGKLARWRRISIEAARQCGRPRPMDIAGPVPLSKALTAWPGKYPLLVGSLYPGSSPILRIIPNNPSAEIGLLVGPEGDLTPEEHAQALQAGGRPACLGPLTLRSETAALSALAIISAKWQDSPPGQPVAAGPDQDCPARHEDPMT